MHQRERFAVAMLAFALKQDCVFRKNFLQNVCECGNDVDPKDFFIELEVKGCGDLVLRKDNPPEVYALEFKIGADLQYNQDPRNPDFFKSGYGKNIKDKYAGKTTYIVVPNPQLDFSRVSEKEPCCPEKSWGDVAKCPHDNSDRLLVHDLFKSFGALRIPEFMNMTTQGLKLGQHAINAVRINTLLDAVVGKLDLKKKREPDWELQPDAKHGYTVVWVSGGARETVWKNLVQPTGKEFGSFGYTDYANEKPALEVWLPCGTKEAAKRVFDKLQNGFPNKPEVVGIDGNNIWITLPAEESPGDQQWFISVFDTLVPRK